MKGDSDYEAHTCGFCVVLVMAMLAMWAGPAAAGSKRTSMLDSGFIGSESVGVQGLKNGYSGYGDG